MSGMPGEGPLREQSRVVGVASGGPLRGAGPQTRRGEDACQRPRRWRGDKGRHLESYFLSGIWAFENLGSRLLFL